jgi:integrase
LKIAKRSVESAESGFHWDEGLLGFGIRVSETGTISYVVKLASGRRGRSSRVTIGQHGAPWIDQDGKPVTLTAEIARKEALRLLGERHAGKDPAAARRAVRRLPTFAEFAETYMIEAANHKKPRSLQEDEGNLRRVLLPYLGTTRIDQITRADVQRLHADGADRPTNANRNLALLSHMMNRAEAMGLRPDGSNPCRHVQRYKENRRKRYLNGPELGRLFLAVESIRDVYVQAAIKLLIFTGARRNEILSLRWEHVDLKAGLLRLSDSKTGSKDVVISSHAVNILRDIPRLSGSPFVLPGRRRGTHLVEIPWERIRDQAGIPDVRLHDVRHTFASVLVTSGASLPVIGGILGHASPVTTARYAHLADDPARAAAEAAGDLLRNFLDR